MKLRHFAVFGGIFTVIICLLLFLFIVTADDEENSTSYFDFSGLNLSEEVLKHQPTVEKYAKEYGISDYVNYLLAIMQVESGGTATDVMQSSESMGLPPNSLSTEESIKQGCKYFSELLKSAEAKGCDINTVVQSYNYDVELLNALAQLNHKKCKGLIIDLRGNTGGYMEAAIRMVNEFLPEGKLIVYTQGRKYPRAEEFANGTGSCQKMPLVVLIDEGSASASEIFTGAIQDNDRGTVVGRRSFGKGLVQQPIDFSDGSAIRLTIARYYTPAGRCIQRPYESGKDRNYELDLFNRYEHGEFFSRDSIKQNENELYYTSLGRPVYGGGGIMPDIFVPQDTTGVTSYLSTAINRGLTIQFTFQYTDNNRKKLSQYETEEELLNYLRHQGLVEQFVRFAESKGLKRRNILIQKSYKLLEKNIYGNIIYNMLGLEAYLQYFNKTDATVNKGIEILEKGEAFPKAPVAVEEEDTKDKKNEKKKRTAQAYRIVEDPTLYFDYAEASIS